MGLAGASLPKLHFTLITTLPYILLYFEYYFLIYIFCVVIGSVISVISVIIYINHILIYYTITLFLAKITLQKGIFLKMKAKFEFQAFLKPSATINFTLLPEGWEQLISGSGHEFATGVSRYYEGLKIVFSSVAEEPMIHKFLDFIHPALRHQFGDVLGYFTFDNKVVHLLVYTPETIKCVTVEPL